MSRAASKKTARRRPKQARALATVDAIVEGAARVFRREGWAATTNRIAEAAGVSIGTLYEYFPDKQALLLALAERHVALAESELAAALALPPGSGLRSRLSAVQAAIVASQRFPSHALSLVQDVERVGPELRARADALRTRVLATLTDEAAARDLPQPGLRAEAAFDALAELTCRAIFEAPERQVELSGFYLQMALALFGE